MLEVRGLSKRWPDFALDMSLSVHDRTIAALLGPSGCGKSSFLRLLCGLIKPDSGIIVLNGKKVDGLAPERRNIGMVFQDFALFPGMSVRKNIEFAPKLRRAERTEREDIVGRLADSFEIRRLLDRAPEGLSGGEQQRVALARTLAAKPEFVLLDEPLSSLDANLRKRLRLEIAQKLRETGLSAIHVTHDVEEAFAVADRIFLMDRGSLVEEGSPEELYTKPRSAYAARFLGLGPLIPLRGAQRHQGGLRIITDVADFICAPGAADSAPRKVLAASAHPLGPELADQGRSFLFFPADAIRLLPAFSEQAARKDNCVSALVLESVFAGRFRRLRLSCLADDPRRNALIEVELPTDCGVSRGDRIAFFVPPESCMPLS